MVDGRPVAEWWQRFVARLIDGAVVFVPILLLYTLVTAILAAGGAFVFGWGMPAGWEFFTGLLALGLMIGYEFVMLNRWGRTLGKMAMGLRVLPLHTPPQAEGGLDNRTAGLRALMWWGPVGAGNIIPIFGTLVSFAVPLVNGLWPLWDEPNRQSLNDKVAHTVVIADH